MNVPTVNTDFDAVMDGAASIATAAYLVSVVYQGNLFPFLTAIKADVGFLEWVVAIYILTLILKVDALRPIVGMFVVGAILVALLRASQNFNADLFTQFANGQISLTSLLLNLTKGN